MNTTYLRVIPRDLFNESSLLKCLGRFWIETERFQSRHHGGPGVTIEHDGMPFDVWQDDDGKLSVGNIAVLIHGNHYHVCRPLNSREAWPLYLDTGDDLIAVFTGDGELTPEVIALINASTPPNPNSR